MRHLLVLLLLPFLALAAVHANATSECASALQLQDTVRSSLRSENTAASLRELVADNKAALQKLQDAIDSLGRATDKSFVSQSRATDESFETQNSAIEKLSKKQDLWVYLVVGVGVPVAFFVLVFPQRVAMMLKAYSGQPLAHAAP
jgi:Skp family chaperone for outer membrane proteins